MSYLQGVLLAMHVALCLAGMWCTLCRLNYMGKHTRHGVTAEYFLLGTLCALLMVVQTAVWVFVLLSAIMIRFYMTSKYWKHARPSWSLKI